MATVICVDTGYKRDLYHNRLAPCLAEAFKVPFLVSTV